MIYIYVKDGVVISTLQKKERETMKKEDVKNFYKEYYKKLTAEGIAEEWIEKKWVSDDEPPRVPSWEEWEAFILRNIRLDDSVARWDGFDSEQKEAISSLAEAEGIDVDDLTEELESEAWYECNMQERVAEAYEFLEKKIEEIKKEQEVDL